MEKTKVVISRREEVRVMSQVFKTNNKEDIHYVYKKITLSVSISEMRGL